MSINLRLRGPSSSSSLVLPPDASFGHLRKQITNVLQLDVNRPFEILLGFPPLASTHSDDIPVSEVLRSGDSIRIQYASQSGVQRQGVGVMKVSNASKKKVSDTTSKKNYSVTSSPALGSRAVSPGSSSTSRQPPPFHVGESGSSSYTTGSSEATRKIQSRKRKSNPVQSEEDLSEALLSAVDGGGSRRDRVLRSIFRNAVLHQYEETKAVDRVNASKAGTYNILESPTQRILGSGHSSAIEVTFSKGHGSRSNHTDHVDLLSKDLLLAAFKVALQEPESKEALKPMNLSRCSPRLFWSLVFHYGPDPIRGIQEVLHGIDDCSWLEDRKKMLSEKAKENAIQQQQKADASAARKAQKMKKNNVSSSDGGAAESTELSMMERVIVLIKNIATSKFSLNSIVSSERESLALTTALDSTENGQLLWKLAECEPSVQLAQSVNSKACSSSSANEISVSDIEGWIDNARFHVLQVIWHVVCGGGSTRLKNALEKLRIRAPNEIKMWLTAPEGLLEGLLALDEGLATNIKYNWYCCAETDVHQNLTEDKIKWMCEICVQLLEKYPWLQYAEPLSSDDSNELGIENEDDEQPSQKKMKTIETSTADTASSDEVTTEWLYDSTAHQFIGSRARIWSDDSELFWEDGTVVAYLPPDDEEPMALWKVKLDEAAVKSKSKDEDVDRMEDLEEHEIKDAIARFLR